MADYSHSKLSAFENCRCRYKLHYIDRISEKQERSIETFMGSMVHETLEKLYTDRMNGVYDPLETILEYYDNIWSENYVDTLKINKRHMKAENYHAIGRIYIRGYYNSHIPLEEMEIIGLETEDIMVLPNGRTYDIKIDKLARIGNDYFVCDYKTDSKMKTQRVADSDRQLAMYSAWVRQNYPDAERIHLLWHMLSFDKDVRSERTDEQLDSLINDTVDLITEIESCTDWSPNVSVLCNYCELKKHCPAFKTEDGPEQ